MTLIVALARAYVAAFAICFALIAIIGIVEPDFGRSEPPYPRRADLLAGALRDLSIAAAALLAAGGVRHRTAKRLASLVLVAGALWSAYTMLAVAARHPILGAVAIIVVTFPFYLGPVCVGLWLFSRLSTFDDNRRSQAEATP